MPELNKANRQVCDVDIRILSGYVPFLSFEDANTTTAGFSSDNVYAMSKGSRKITFQNPIEGTMSITGQVRPFKLFSLFSDGVIDTTAVYADKQTVKAVTGGSLAIKLPAGSTLQEGTLFVYPENSFGDKDARIDGQVTANGENITFASGSMSNNTFNADTSKIVADEKYIVGYIVQRGQNVKKISFNNKKLPKDYYITMKTVDKDENGDWAEFKMVAYKAAIQRNLELSFSSEGEPAEFTLSFDLSEDKEGNVLDFIELEDEETVIEQPGNGNTQGESDG